MAPFGASRAGLMSVDRDDIPDSDLTQYTVVDDNGDDITVVNESELNWTDTLGVNKEDHVFRAIDVNKYQKFTNTFDIEHTGFVNDEDLEFDSFMSGIAVGDSVIGDNEFVGMVVGDNRTNVDNLSVFIVTEPSDNLHNDPVYEDSNATEVFGTFGRNDTVSISIDYDFEIGELSVSARGNTETQSFDETRDWSFHHVIATGPDIGFSLPGTNSGELTNHSFEEL